MTATTLYATENKRKTLAGLLVLAIGFALGQLGEPARPPDVTPQLIAARQPVVRQHAASRGAGAQLASAQRTIAQLRSAIASQRSTIARQQAQIRALDRHRRQGAAHRRKRRR